MLLRPGRGPLRPRVEEAGKEDRRRERGMIHPEELELETLQPGNSLARADGRAWGGGGCSPGRAPRPAPAASCSLPGRWGRGGLFYEEFKAFLGKVSRWCWSDRSSRSLAQVSPAAASVQAEEV